MARNDKTVTTIESTKEYERFSYDPVNRPVSPRHVKNLMEKMRVKYQLAPIMVNRHMQILDGQHRFEAAKALGLPINYYISKDAEVGDMADLNNAAKNWTNKDRAHHFKEMGNEHYQKYFDFVSRFPKFSFSMALILLSGDTSRKRKIEEEFQEGYFKVKKYADAVSTANFLQSISTFYPGWNRRSFVLAVLQMRNHKDFDDQRFLRKMRMKGGSLSDFANTEDYLRKLEEFYNYREQKIVRFF